MSNPNNLAANQPNLSVLQEHDSENPGNAMPQMATDDLAVAKQMAIDVAIAADDRKAKDIRILQLSDVSYIADYFVIATGFSNTKVRRYQVK